MLLHTMHKDTLVVIISFVFQFESMRTDNISLHLLRSKPAKARRIGLKNMEYSRLISD